MTEKEKLKEIIETTLDFHDYYKVVAEWKRRAETAETVISDLRAKLTKAEHDRKRYKAKIEELRKEIRK